jgi:hypothetical protein
MYRIERNDREIDRLLDDTIQAESEGTKFPGMTYEEGVRAAIDWITGNSDDYPMDE